MSFNIQAAEQHRAVLGLGSHFSEQELKKAYRDLIKLWHPDKFPGQTRAWDDAQEKMKAINNAAEFLSEVLESNGGSYRAPGETGRANAGETCSSADLQPKHTYQGKTYNSGFPDPTVTEIFLRSSHIISTGYSRATRTLYIKVTWAVYRYLNVPETVFESFLKAPSHGKFRHWEILHRFREELC
ncbi:MAG: KTSC domain-containing protein [Planctomycetaceae bacterium]